MIISRVTGTLGRFFPLFSLILVVRVELQVRSRRLFCRPSVASVFRSLRGDRTCAESGLVCQHRGQLRARSPLQSSGGDARVLFSPELF